MISLRGNWHILVSEDKLLVCGLFGSGGTVTEIKTGYRGFEMNEIRYFECLLVCSEIIHTEYMSQNL